jgi:hypothetical protein
MSNGLSFLVSYTVSKNLTDADSAGPGVSGFIGTNEFIGQNSYQRSAEKAVSQLDTPQALVASFFYELPVGRGKRFMNQGGFSDRVLGGWYASTILSYKSGTPTEVYAPCNGTAGDVLFGGCHFTGAARVNVIPGINQTNKSSDFNPETTPFWNPAAFAIPDPLTFGNEPRSLSNARTFGRRYLRQENQALWRESHRGLPRRILQHLQPPHLSGQRWESSIEQSFHSFGRSRLRSTWSALLLRIRRGHQFDWTEDHSVGS